MRFGAIVLLGLVAVLAGCGALKHDCSGGEACRGSNGDCMKCDAPYSCNSGGTCSNTVNGVACCTGGGGGGGGGGGCGCGTNCNSNGVCCPKGWYGCKNTCYSSYNAMLSAGCSGATTCCP